PAASSSATAAPTAAGSGPHQSVPQSFQTF
ncbi:MAG: hypothetical protein QOE52_909, partial [Mycobacterium sp.]|nr:hypothetical protein [Mycobacterium sp.]